MAPPSRVARIVPTLPTAQPGRVPRNARPEALPGAARLGCQVAPPSRVARMVPPSPTAQPVSGPAKCTPQRSSSVPLVCGVQVAPPSWVARMVPPVADGPAGLGAREMHAREVCSVPLGLRVSRWRRRRGSRGWCRPCRRPSRSRAPRNARPRGLLGAAGLGCPGGAAVAGGEDRAALADRPAGLGTGEMHGLEVMLGAAGLGCPGGAAVAGGEDRAALADGPAGLGAREMHGREVCSVPLVWGVQVAPPSRVARMVPPSPTAQPCRPSSMNWTAARSGGAGGGASDGGFCGTRSSLLRPLSSFRGRCHLPAKATAALLIPGYCCCCCACGCCRGSVSGGVCWRQVRPPSGVCRIVT